MIVEVSPDGVARPTLMLVHGGRHGSWCWRRMLTPLRAAGAEVYAPTLSGMAERRHQLGPEIDLDAHIRDVVEMLDFHDLHDVVIVGHSYGGMVVTGAADRRPERVAGVIYLDAAVTGDGGCVLDTISPEYADRMRTLVAEHGDGWRLPGDAQLARDYGVSDPADLAWAGPLITDQSFATYTQPLTLTGAVARLPRAYVRFTESAAITPAAAASVRESGASWRELPVCHDAIITDPQLVTECVLELVNAWESEG